MEAIHGVDTSWLHRPTSTTTSAQPTPASTPPRKPTPPPEVPREKAQPPSQKPATSSSSSNTPNAPISRSSSSGKRPSFLSRTSSAEKTPTKSSWMSSISSKFSSSSSAAPAPISTSETQTRARASSATAGPKSPIKPGNAGEGTQKQSEESEPYVPQQPKSSGRFLSGALRRLSSSSGSSNKPAAAPSSGIIVPRMTLNVDKDRERCKIKELNQGKLRRVAFNVDVEIAGVSNYIYEDDVSAEAKEKDKQTQARSEGEALKHPDLAEKAKERTTNSAGLFSASALDEHWGDTPGSPKVKGEKSFKTSGDQSKAGLTQASPGAQRQAGESAATGRGGSKSEQPNDLSRQRSDSEHDILRHLSGMDEDWGGSSARSQPKTTVKKTRDGGSLYSAANLDEWHEEDDVRSRERSRSEPPQRRSSDRSVGSRRDMLALLADDDWSEDNSPKSSPAGPQAKPGPSQQSHPPERASLDRSTSSPAPLSLDKPGPQEPTSSQQTPQPSQLPSQKPNIPATSGPSATAPNTQQLQPPVNDQTRGTSASPAGRPQDRPTTDPLRIYRRCCQLREAPVLKRISEQLSKPENFGVEADGVVGSLNLNRSRMQPNDIVCLSDWLAIVPVKRLMIEDANLTDDGLRQILAGLLATKTPEMARKRRGRSSPTRSQEMHNRKNPGVIEKLSLKNNKKLTEDGWRHLCVFINMSISLRSIDVSLIPFPRSATAPADSSTHSMADILCKALVERRTGSMLEELLIADCGLTAQHVERITRAASRGLARLGLANNRLDDEGLGYVARYLRSGACSGIDLGGNNLQGKLHLLTDSFNPQLLAISVANCDLLPADLERLFGSLAALPDLRLLHVSHNRELFSAGNGNSSLAIVRKWLPRMKLLKRLHIADVSLTPEQAIGIAEILPECRNLAHVNLLENPPLKEVIAHAAEQEHQEEACALFASLMTAVRLSKTLVCVDIDVPGPTASEVVKALARQVVAYCLRNIELFTEADAIQVADAAAALPDVDKSNDSGIELLQHFLEHQPGAIPDAKGKVAMEDYFVGGTGVVKALSYILSASQTRGVPAISRPGTPSAVMESDLGKAQARDMSKTLLESAKKYREGLQPVIARESAANKTDVLLRLTFLDETLRGIIERFEVEYPSARPTGASGQTVTTVGNDYAAYGGHGGRSSPSHSRASSVDSASSRVPLTETYTNDSSGLDQPTSPGWRHTWGGNEALQGGAGPKYGSLARRESEVDLHNRELVSEEGTMHRFGQRLRREFFPPKGQNDYLHRTSVTEQDPNHLAVLRSKFEAFGGDEVKEMFLEKGIEATIRDIANDAEMLRNLELTDPVGFQQYKEAQLLAQETGALPRDLTQGDDGANTGRNRGMTA